MKKQTPFIIVIVSTVQLLSTHAIANIPLEKDAFIKFLNKAPKLEYARKTVIKKKKSGEFKKPKLVTPLILRLIESCMYLKENLKKESKAIKRKPLIERLIYFSSLNSLWGNYTTKKLSHEKIQMDDFSETLSAFPKNNTQELIPYEIIYLIEEIRKDFFTSKEQFKNLAFTHYKKGDKRHYFETTLFIISDRLVHIIEDKNLQGKTLNKLLKNLPTKKEPTKGFKVKQHDGYIYFFLSSNPIKFFYPDLKEQIEYLKKKYSLKNILEIT